MSRRNDHRRAPASAPVVNAELLGLLLRADEPVTVEAMALARGWPRAQVLVELDRLREAGCRFDEHPQHGLRLLEAGLGTWVDYLQHAAGPTRVIEVYRQTASTQDVCRRIVTTWGNQSDRAIAVADQQTAGRGRLGRRWLAPPGSAVTFSQVRVLADNARGSAVDRLTFAASVATADAVQAMLGGRSGVTVKWPNDVYVDGRKIAGILVETFQPPGPGPRNVRTAILGLGLNVNLQAQQLPAELRDKATSLAMCGASVDRLHALTELVSALDTALERTHVDELLTRWRQRCVMLHHPVRVQCEGREIHGQVIDLDPHEGLIVRSDSGEITHLPAATTTVL